MALPAGNYISLFAGAAGFENMTISQKHTDAARRNLQVGIESRASRNISRPCETCKAVMSIRPCHAESKRFCSWVCRTISMKGENAPNYGKGKKLRGPLNYNFKSGTSSSRVGNKIARRFRQLVLARDGQMCIVCRSGGPLHAHHIDDFASFPLLQGDPNNGVTLCVPCHKKAHSKMGGYGFITLEGKVIWKFRNLKHLPENGSTRIISTGTFILGWS